MGEDPYRAGLRAAPSRAAASYAELLDGVGVDPERNFVSFAESTASDLVTLVNIGFTSVCEHNLLPFVGRAHLAYLPGPDRLIAGWGELTRLVTGYAHRPQIQERLTSQIADSLQRLLQPAGVMVIVEAQHQCLSLVGERQSDARVATMAARGCYVDDSVARSEVSNLLRST
ncbi:MAG: GTP cyclohydrolase I [Mycobacteriales bacterium]